MTGILLTLVSRGSTTLSYTAVPVISGTVSERSVLTATNGIWLGAVPITYSYQWFANGAPVASGSNSYTIQTADIGKSFTCRVAATNFYGTIVAESLATTNVTQALPTKPVVTYTGLSTTGFTLNWSASESGITGYDVYNNTTKLTSSPITTLTYAITGLTAQTSYPFYVKAINAIGTTSSDVLNVITDANPPTGLTQSSITSTGFTLSWTVTSGVSYTIFNGSTQVGSAQTTGNIAITGLSPQTAYTFYVKATSTGSSNAVSSTGYTITTAPAAPTGVSATSIAQTTFTLNWIGYSGVTYTIFNGSTQVGTDISGSNGAMSQAITGLTAFTSYSFYVKATTISNSVVSAIATSAALSVQTLKTAISITKYGGGSSTGVSLTAANTFIPNGASATVPTDITLTIASDFYMSGDNRAGNDYVALTINTDGLAANSKLTVVVNSGVTIAGQAGAAGNVSGSIWLLRGSHAANFQGTGSCPIYLYNYGTIVGGGGGGGAGGSGQGSAYQSSGYNGWEGGGGLRTSNVYIMVEGTIAGGGGGGGGGGAGIASSGTQSGSGSSGTGGNSGTYGKGGNGGNGNTPSSATTAGGTGGTGGNPNYYGGSGGSGWFGGGSGGSNGAKYW